jgi:hypothetical protein
MIAGLIPGGWSMIRKMASGFPKGSAYSVSYPATLKRRQRPLTLWRQSSACIPVVHSQGVMVPKAF